jgi:hypothetical protein
MSQPPIRLYIADNYNFHRRNFDALFELTKRDKLDFHVNRKRKGWWLLHGNYAGEASRLAPHRARLDVLSAADLLAISHNGVNVFSCARAEILCLVLVLDSWVDRSVRGDDDRTLIEELFAESRETLLSNMAAAMEWLDFWLAEFGSGRRYTHCCVFSGSNIYSRTLLETCRRVGVRAFVMETFFTGNHFYCEEKFGPVSNNSDLGIDNYYDAIAVPEDVQGYARACAEAHEAIRGMRSLNVRPDSEVDPKLFGNGKPVAFIVGQVENDFAIMQTSLKNINGIEWVKVLIDALLENTDFNIVFKAHPWERKRVNLCRPLTFEKISTHIAAMPEDRRARVAIVENPTIASVFRIADWVFLQCSQAGIEAAETGFKPVVFGRPFYGQRGFTHDYTDLNAFLADFRAARVNNRLTPAEYDAYQLFIVKAFVRHLLTDDEAGVDKLRRIFNSTHAVEVAAEIPANAPPPPSRRIRRRLQMAAVVAAIRANPYGFMRDRLFDLRRRITGRFRT